MTPDIAIKISNVSKEFLLPHQKASSLKSVFLNPFSKFKNEKQLALNKVSFEIKKGEFFGIVGRNGSGKSTLLKCMAGVYTPNKGYIKHSGKLVPFIELGVGFNPELSGRDNVYLNAALFGFSRNETDKMYDEIVEFAELEKFMDQKLKNYSSGMQVRLAFSIAIKAQGDILVLDEVLAVGDAAFQRKCNEYFSMLKRTNKTVVLVTHDMNAIEKYCDKAVLISEGNIKSIGGPQDIAYQYTIDNLNNYSENDQKRQEKTQKGKNSPEIKLLNKKGKESNLFERNDELTVEINWKNPEVKNIGVALLTDMGEYIFGTNTDVDDFDVIGTKLKYKLKLNLGEARYSLKIGFYGETDQEKLDFINEGPSFSIVNKDKSGWGGVVPLERSWENTINGK